jgi:hypothetical protein
MTIYIKPPNTEMMDELYAVISSDNEGEGICGMHSPIGNMPMVFGSKKNLEGIRELIKKMAKDTGKKLMIIKYKKSEIIETIDGSH